jgi:putative hemolysin
MNRISFMLMLGLLAAACGPTETPMPAETTSSAGIANPASVYCNDNGGRLEIRTGLGGGQIGVCIFPDGSECEEWAYFRGECQPGATPAAPVPAAVASAEPVMLQVLLPEDGSVSELGECQVVGSTSPGAVVSVNDEILIADSDGAFQTTVTLEAGVNLIEVLASNSSGSEAFVSLTVTYAP